MSKNKQTAQVNPLVNFFMRLTGEWPLSGPPPLTQAQYKEIFSTYPAFVDYFPVVDYIEEDEVYLFDDYINVAKMYEVSTRYMAGKSEASLDSFNSAVALAFNALPADDSNPYVVQVYVNKQEAENAGDYIESQLNPEWKDHAFTQKVVSMMREHSQQLAHEKGIFPDSRMTGEQGWRIGEQKVYLVVYRKKNESTWKKNKKTPAEQLEHDLTSFRSAMQSAGIALKPLRPYQLINWLAPFFGNNTRWTDADWCESHELANHDIGQLIFSEQPSYHHDYEEDNERGIWQFGNKYSRYLTLGGIEKPPRSGAITLGEQHHDGSSIMLSASFFEKLPVGSMMSYALIPQTDMQMKFEMSLVAKKASETSSREADYATEQANTAYEEMMRNNEKIFYAQLGIFLCANSIETLLDNTEQAIAEVRTTRMLQVVEPRWDLFPQHSYIKSLPCVYDFRNDRNASLRARKAYTSHIASILPFFGNKAGSTHPCYTMYSRTGETFYMNPFHPEEKERVSHEVFFGPTGSGKSATVCYMTLMSMAVNNPRTFLFDYGGSFKLLADFAEAHGKKVKRIKFTRNSTDVIAPFFETAKALEEFKQAQLINKGEYVVDTSKKEDEENEERSYINEMEAILRIMVTGGNEAENAKLTQTDLAHLSEALERGLQLSVEQGEAHARPTHIAEAMRAMADEEASRPGGLTEIAHSMHNMATSISRWTKGLHGILFNRTATGFDPDYDLTVIEVGSLAKTPDMMAVAGLSAINNITAMAENLQSSGRGIEVKIDESHLWAKINMLIDGLIVGVKVFRKLSVWLCMITQDISDFKGANAKILTNAEFWWLMRMSESEIKQAAEILNLSAESQHLIKFPKKEPRCFVEGVSICEKYPDALIRYVLPPLALALAQTEGSEKEYRQRVMQENNCTELEAAYLIADEINAKRLAYQRA